MTAQATTRPDHQIPDALSDIKSVETRHGFNASSSVLYAMAEFGRDARQLGVDALTFNPEITRKVIHSLVRHQAHKRNDITEAQPGRFHHEHRQKYVDNTEIPEISQEILTELSEKWGGTEEKVTYYGSFDVTPDTISLIADTAQIYRGILEEKVINEDKHKAITIKESAKEGIHWVEDVLEHGPIQVKANDFIQNFLLKNKLTIYVPLYHNHVLRNIDWLQQKLEPVKKIVPLARKKQQKHVKLFEFQRINKKGITYQSWLDGGTSFIHSSGKLTGILANVSKPIATIEMQASVIDALEKAAFLFPKKLKHYRELADEVRANVIRYFWMKEKNYFASALDRDHDGNIRKIETLQANVGEMLNTAFFDALLEDEREKLLTAIITKLFSTDFLTDAGIRTRAKSEAFLTDLSEKRDIPNSLYDYWDYQGSETSWIVQTGRIAEGLRKQGFYQLADQLDNRILNTVNIAGYNVEFSYIGARGELEDIVAYNILAKGEAIDFDKIQGAKIIEINATNIPESTQTWTASRVAAILHRRNKQTQFLTAKSRQWQRNVEEDILKKIKNISPLDSIEKLVKEKNNGYLFLVNKDQGKKLEKQIIESSEKFYSY